MDITVNSQSNTVAPKQAECKKMRYSIRKVATVGATSALVGTLAFLGATQPAAGSAASRCIGCKDLS